MTCYIFKNEYNYFLLLNINKNIPTILFLYKIAKLWQRYKIGRTSKTSSSITFHPVGIYEYIYFYKICGVFSFQKFCFVRYKTTKLCKFSNRYSNEKQTFFEKYKCVIFIILFLSKWVPKKWFIFKFYVSLTSMEIAKMFYKNLYKNRLKWMFFQHIRNYF